MNKKIAEADLTLAEELEAQKRLDLSTKTLASASMFLLELKNTELQVSAVEKKLKEINKSNV